MPAAVSVSPVEGPALSGRFVAELGDAHAGPFAGRAVPRRSAVGDRHGVAATDDLETHLAAELRWRAIATEALDRGERNVGDCHVLPNEGGGDGGCGRREETAD